MADRIEEALTRADPSAGRDSAPHRVFDELQANLFHILPLTYEIAAEAAALVSLRDPADRAIARVHRLRLVTSDQPIIESKLVPVVA